MNGIMDLIGMMRGAGNPMAFLQQQAQNNPAIAKALEMTQGKGEQGIWDVARNLAKEQGVDLNQFRAQLGL
jgi:hypothetical protein